MSLARISRVSSLAHCKTMDQNPNNQAPQETQAESSGGLAGALAQRRQEMLARGANQAQFVRGNSPQPAPAQAEASSVPEPQPQESGQQAEGSVSLTGEETEQQLRDMGYDGERVQDRVRKLALERNEAVNRQAELEQRLQAIESQMNQGQPQQNAQQQAPQVPQQPDPRDLPIPDYEETTGDKFPEDGSYEDQEQWRLRKQTYEMVKRESRAEIMQFSEVVQKILTPLVRKEAMQQREEQWGEVGPVLEALGTSREEVQPYVDEILRMQPDRSVGDAAYQALGLAGVNVLDAVQARRPAEGAEPPPVAMPSQGRPGPVSQSQDPAAQQLQQIGQRQQQAGGQAANLLAEMWKGRRQAGLIRPQSYQSRS